MDTSSKFNSAKEIITYLSAQFPLCFSVKGEAKPLKIGIFQDLAARLADDEQVSKTQLRSALRRYTASWRYLSCIKDGVNRVDLDGTPCDVITVEQSEHALLRLKESKEQARAKGHLENKQPSSNASKTKRVPNTKKANVNKTKIVKEDNQNSLQKVTISQLKIGDIIKINLGSRPVLSTVSSIEKECVKVTISSGMELTVKAEHIVK